MPGPPFFEQAVTLHDILRWHAQHQPDRPFLTYLFDGERPEDPITFGTLDARVRLVAAELSSRGASPGDRALLLYPQGPDFVVAFLACLAAGVVAVPAYPPRNARHMPRIETIQADAGARLILSVADARDRIHTWRSSRQGTPAALLCTDEIDGGAPPAWTSPDLDRDATAFLQYTSGSTGQPKGVVVSHANLLANLRMVRETFGYDETSDFVTWLPLYHDMGLVGNLLQPLFLGARVTLMSPAAFLQKPVRWLQAISTHRARTTGAPNFAFDLTARAVTPEQKAMLDLTCLELVYNGSEPIDARALDRFAEAFEPCGFRREALFPCYGMAETTLLSTGSRPRQGAHLRSVDADALTRHRVRLVEPRAAGSQTLVGCGYSVDRQDLVIVDPDTRRPVADDVVGEIWLRGPHIARGYWQQPDLTRETFGAMLAGGDGPFLRTGDLGFLDAGELFIAGRLKDVVIIRGRNYYPQDIERTVSESHPALVTGSAAAFGFEADGEERLAVVQEVHRAAMRGLDADAVMEKMRAAVADALDLTLSAVALVKPLNLPKTSSGKIQRRRCRDRWRAGDLDLVAAWRLEHPPAPAPTPAPAPAPGTATTPAVDATRIAQWMRRAVAQEAGRSGDEIDARETFSSYGLDSVSLIRLSGALGAWIALDLPPTILYDYPTIESLARHLAGDVPAIAARDHVAPSAPIAIVGVGCRLPGGVRGPDDFWRLLSDGVDAITQTPVDRWAADAAAQMGGFLDEVDRFDPQFFGIAPREAAAMDPQHRLLLEVAWESLEHAGIPAAGLAGSSTGVFVGVSTNDYARLLLGDADQMDMYSGIGSAASAASGRLSYVLGVHGPSLSVDTACSSSLVAVHLAVRSLRAGECDLALAGGVNLMLAPDLTVAFSKAGMMAIDGRCKTFDASADGYVRAEGCGVVVLKRLDEAVETGDRVVAIIRGSAINQDGRSNGLTAPNGPAQQQVLRRALEDAAVEPRDIDYVEAHGTGTSLGDPIEVGALAAVLGDGRTSPLVIGSVKSNLGHLEAAAGIAGFIKTALALERGTIPRSLHFTTPNRYIPWASLPIAVAAESRRFPPGSRPRLAGVSSFGFTGTNAHVVLEQAPAPAQPPAPADRPLHLLPISAKDEGQLRALVQAYSDALGRPGDRPIADICHTAGGGRDHFNVRVAVVAATHDEMRSALAHAASSVVDPSRAPRLAWLFSGQGSQYDGMGRQLRATEPAFRVAFDRCADIVRSIRGRWVDDLEAGAIDRTEWTQPALFALEYALAELWRSWGITPCAMLGHSVGEIVAATVAGVFSLEDGLRLVCERGRLMQSLPAGGGMLAVFTSEAVAAEAASGEPLVSIAATNAADETVLSGDSSALDRIARRLSARGVGTKRLATSHAFHSQLVSPISDALAAFVARLSPAPATVPIVSNVTGGVAGADLASAEYWRRHVTAPVRFLESVATLAQMAPTHVIELGPAPVLSALAARSWTGRAVQWLPSLRRGRPDSQPMLESLAALYLSGAAVDWRGLDRDRPRRRVTLPTYPFRRDRCWISRVPQSRTPEQPAHPTLGVRLPSVATSPGCSVWQLDPARLRGPLCQEYRIDGVASPSVALYLHLAATAIREALGAPVRLGQIEFTGVDEVATDRVAAMQIVVSPFGASSADCRVFVRGTDDSGWSQVAGTRGAVPGTGALARPPLDFGIMFFNGSEDQTGRHHYRLVLEAARFADRQGFSSIWAPERHYTAFGGLYPNPSVLHAALARETRRVRLMAGSLVVPLHHPLRAAEDWALVDNLSNGRVGISLASGWNPSDFAMAPHKYADRREDVFVQLETLRRLWRGETIGATSGDGRSIDVRTYPSPVQREFPAWITAAGNPATFERAGAAGTHLLTHLLDQGVEELARKIAIYRQARGRAGHDPATGRVTVMLHTFVGEELADVRERVRVPYCDYIKANMGLLKGLAYSRGSHVDIAALSPRDLDEFVGFLYERFFTTRALIGTPESCADIAEQLYAAGVDELACLVDFGPPTGDVLRSLPHLDRLRERVRAGRPVAADAAAAIPVDLPAVRSRCAQRLPAPVFYRRLAGRGVTFDTGLQLIQELVRRDGEALAELQPMAAANPLSLDAALQAFVAALPADAFVSTTDATFVPWEAAGLAIRDPDAVVQYAHARLDPDGEERTASVTGTATLLSPQGVVVATLDRLVMRRVEPSQAPPRAPGSSDCLYEIQWAPIAEGRPGSPAAGRWLLLGDAGGVGARLAEALTQQGRAVTLVGATDLDALDAVAIAAAVSREAAAGDLAGVVNLWALDAGAADEASDASIARGEELGVAATLHLAQALLALPRPARIWVVTRHAQVVGEPGGAPAIAQAPAWGLGRVIAVDHPELWGGLVDLAPESNPQRDADAVLTELAADVGEDQVAVRGGCRFAPRLVPQPVPAATAPPRFETGATYLITGGVGGLGRRVAHWMVRHGATDLVLTARHALPPEEEWDRRLATIEPGVRERIAGVRSLQAQGATVTVLQADAASRRDMLGVFDVIAQRQRPLRGIVHLAGLPENQPLSAIRFDRDRAILGPKVAGAWLLHELSRDMPLDLFVAFSSISAVWGSRGQTMYAAANQFLDALAAFRRARGLPALTVSWGPWSEGGMVDRHGLQLLSRMGIGSLNPDEATAILWRLLDAGVSHRVVAHVDWLPFKELFESRVQRRFFDHVGNRAGASGPAGAAPTDLRRGLAALDAAERGKYLVAHVAREVAVVLGWPTGEPVDGRTGFFDMGMDSLTALELKNRLQSALALPLRATIIFNHSTVVALAAYLDSLIAPAEVPASDLDHLNENELARLLDEQISAADAGPE